MENNLDIEGRVVKRACKFHDYIQLYFDDGSILNIFNRVVEPASSDNHLESLANTTLLKVSLKEGVISFAFSNGKQLGIGISDTDYQSPEALEFINAQGRRIVWN
jgi:hypothetical protein